MKRSELRRKTPLRAKTPIRQKKPQAKTPPERAERAPTKKSEKVREDSQGNVHTRGIDLQQRKKGLNAVGARAKRRASALRAAYLEVDARAQGHCEARVAGVCQGQGVEHHHVGKRSVWPELVCDPRNILHVCRPCHDLVTSDQERGEALGLHMPRSYDAEVRFGLREDTRDI